MLKTQIDLKLTLAKDLDELLETPCDIICVRELIKLAFDLLSSIEAEFAVGTHRSVICIAVLVGANQQVDVVAECPPDRRPLAIEHR